MKVLTWLSAALCSVMTSQCVRVPSSRSVGWGGMRNWHFCISCLIQHTFQKHFWITPMSRPFIYTADNSLLPLPFLRSVSILSGSPIINILSCHQDRELSSMRHMACHPHTRFHYSKLLTHLSYAYGSFSNISGMDFSVSNYWKVSNL
jgi:hypothetical protein